MASLSFTKTGNQWEATISGMSGTITVDLERKAIGAVAVHGKLSGRTNYKFMGNVVQATNSPNVIFEVANDADSATLDLKIISHSEVTSGNYE